MRPKTPMLLAHGGAGRRALGRQQQQALEASLAVGSALLQAGGSALDAVEITIRALEGSGVFNAGVGANRQLDGIVRLDASIMDGTDLRAGAVASIQGIRHPISAARHVMDDSAHVLLVGPAATRFATIMGVERYVAPRRPIETLPRPRSPLERHTLTLYRSVYQAEARKRASRVTGTVGAVALDQRGHVAAGASTGGVALMLPGRVGDSPQIGSGVYADDRLGAVSMTGVGEGIIRLVMAKTILERMGGGRSPAVSARLVLQELVTRIQGAAGTLVLAPNGRFSIQHTTSWMAAGYWRGRGRPIVQGNYRQRRAQEP